MKLVGGGHDVCMCVSPRATDAVCTGVVASQTQIIVSGRWLRDENACNFGDILSVYM